MKRAMLGVGAAIGATMLVGGTMGPAVAAETVARADANAVTVSVAGQSADSGIVRARHDGTKLTKTGETEPPVSVLQGQDLLDVGTLAQDATAGLDGRDGISEACAGIAGDGATVAEVGDSSCISGGDNVGLSIANLDLGEIVVINEDSALGPIATSTNETVQLALTPLQDAIDDAVAALGELPEVAVGGDLGVVEARCTAEPGRASGSTHIVDAQLDATFGESTFVLADLPVSPAPNTELPTDVADLLDAVTSAVEDSLTASLETAFADGALTAVLDPALLIVDMTRQDIIDNVVAQVAPQLEPLEDLLQVTLNKQTRPSKGHIEVTGIDLQVLRAAATALGAPLVSAQLANVSCGPNSRVAAEESDDDLPEVPTVVAAGADGGSDTAAGALFAGSLLLVGLSGLLGYRRLTAR